nr:hypothetical protein [Tanacetum cinerariifolium]
MSRDVITVGSKMRILLLYRGEYSQWRERFMNYLEEQTNCEAMINSIQNGDQPLPVIAQVNKTAKDLWDALERQMRGSEYVEQDRKATILCDMNDALGYKKKAVVVTSDPLALVTEKTKVSKRKVKVVVSLDSEGSGADKISELKKITALLAKSANKKQNFVKSDDKKEDKKADEKKRDMSKVKCYNCKKEGHFAKDCKKEKVKDYNYYKTNMLLAKKDSDEQVLLTEDQAWMESSSDSDQEINANMIFMAQIEKVLLESDESSSSVEETIAEVSYYTSESESESEFKTSDYYDNSTNYGLFMNDNDDQEFFHDVIESASENFIENHIDSQKDYDKSKVDHNDSKEKEYLVDKLIQKFNHKIAKCQNRIEKANQQSKHFKNQNKDLQEKCDVLINQVNTFKEKNNEFNEQIEMLNEKNADLLDQIKVLKDPLQVKHIVIATHVECLEIEKFKRARENKIEFAYDYGNLNVSYVNEKINFLDDYFQEIINPNFEKIDSSFQQTSSLKPYVPNVILEKIIIALEDEVVTLLEKEKENLKTIESLKSKGFESSENAFFELENQSENDCHVVEKECDQVKNSKVIAPGMFKLSVSQSVSPISMSKTSCESNNVEIKLKRKRRKRKSSTQNNKHVTNDLSRANRDFVHFSDLDTFSSVRKGILECLLDIQKSLLLSEFTTNELVRFTRA